MAKNKMAILAAEKRRLELEAKQHLETMAKKLSLEEGGGDKKEVKKSKAKTARFYGAHRLIDKSQVVVEKNIPVPSIRRTFKTAVQNYEMLSGLLTDMDIGDSFFYAFDTLDDKKFENLKAWFTSLLRRVNEDVKYNLTTRSFKDKAPWGIRVWRVK